MLVQAAVPLAYAPLTVRVAGTIEFDARAIHPRAHALLWRGLTFTPPARAPRSRHPRWGGRAEEDLTLLERQDEALVAPRGAIRLLREALANVGQALDIDDQRATHAPCDFEAAFTLRDYQRQAVAALVHTVQGCVVVPCGGGKTVIGCGAIAAAHQPALVLVHTHDLLEQWREAVGRFLGIEAGVCADGTMRLASVTVATVQTLSALPRETLATLGQRFGTVVVDECHHCPAVTFRAVLAQLPGKYRFGLTATPERSDGLSPLLPLGIGPIVFEVNHQDLIDAGHLVVPRIVPVWTGCTLDADDHGALVSALVVDEARNAVLVELIRREAEQGRAVLVLSGRVEHCTLLATRLEAAGVGAAVLTGAVSRTRRNALLARFREGTLGVVCATSLADEGLDIARLERLVLATPARAEGRTIQRLGRLMRPFPGKATPELHDLVDEAPLARAQFGARLRAYRSVLGPASTAGVFMRRARR